MTTLPPLEVVSYWKELVLRASGTTLVSLAQMRVVMSSPGSTGLLNRTASRFSRVGSPSQVDSMTTSPSSVRVSSLVDSVVPDDLETKPTGAALEIRVMPGTIGRWKIMSCSPWTTNGIRSCGATASVAGISDSNTGTMANTGGA